MVKACSLQGALRGKEEQLHLILQQSLWFVANCPAGPKASFLHPCSPAGAGTRPLLTGWAPTDETNFLGNNLASLIPIQGNVLRLLYDKIRIQTNRHVFPKAICTFWHVGAPEFLPLAESLQYDILLTFPSFACHFFSKLHLDFRLPIKHESRFSSKNLQCEHLVRGDLTGPL